MMNLKKVGLSSTVVSLALMSEIAGFSQIAQAQAPVITFPAPPAACTAISEVSTGQTTIRKTIGVRNQNTDFAVPTGRRFRSYIINIIPENNAKYTVAINLKYNTGNHATVFSRTLFLPRLELFTKHVRSPVAQQPFQVNLDVTGPLNNVYNLSVLACR